MLALRYGLLCGDEVALRKLSPVRGLLGGDAKRALPSMCGLPCESGGARRVVVAGAQPALQG